MVGYVGEDARDASLKTARVNATYIISSDFKSLVMKYTFANF